MELKDRLRDFIVDVVAIESGFQVSDVRDDESLVDAGILDSLGILKLVSFLDEELGIDLPLEKFTLEDFSSINSICKLVDEHGTA